MNWIKLFYEARTDIKLKKLSPKQFRVWFNLLLFSAEQQQRGTIVADDFYLLSLEVSEEDEELLVATLAILLKLKMISYVEEEGLHTVEFLHFEERQYDKPSDRPESVRERVQRHRETKKTSSVTPVKRDVTPGNTTDEKRRDETREEENRKDGDETREEGVGETTPLELPQEVFVRPSVSLEQAPVPSVPDPAQQKPASSPPQRPPEWRLSDADYKSLLKDGWGRQEIEWGIEIGIEDGTVPRVARSVLHAKILPDVREGKRPQRLTANSPPSELGKPKAVEVTDAEVAELAVASARRKAIMENAIAQNRAEGGQDASAIAS